MHGRLRFANRLFVPLLIVLLTSGCVSTERELAPMEGVLDDEVVSTAEDTPKLRWSPTNIQPSSTIHVCFAPDASGFRQYQEWVREAVRQQWQASSGLDLVGWEICHANTRGQMIVVRFEHSFAADATGALRTVRLERDFKSMNPDTGCSFNDRPCEAFLPPRDWCWHNERYCTQAYAVHAFGRALGFELEAAGMDSVMSPHTLPVLYRDGALSPLDRAGVQSAFGPRKPYYWISVRSSHFPGESLAIGAGAAPDGTQQRVCRAPVNGAVYAGGWSDGACRIALFGTVHSVLDAELLFGTGVTWRPLSAVGIEVGVGSSSTANRNGACRAAVDGRMLIGHRVMTSGRCNIAYNGQARVWSAGYEVLAP